MINRVIHRMAGVVALCAAASFAAPSAAVQSPVCPADFDCSGHVGTNDLLFLLAEWGTPGSIADLTGNGTVGVPDLLQLLGLWGPCVFEYPTPPPNTEAWHISLEMLGESGPLVPPDEIYQRVVRDQNLIRKEVPALVGKIHVPAWMPNQIITSYPATGETPNVDCLLTAYQGQVVNIFFGHMHVIQFPGQANMAAMSALFTAAPETAWAEPDHLLGGDKFWVPTDLGNGTWHWWIDDGWHDCFDGCDCHIFYEIEVDADGNVKVLDVSQWGMPWCEWPG